MAGLSILLLLNLISVAKSYIVPSKFLSIASRQPKCVTIQSTKGTTISIAYSTPDLALIPKSSLNDPKATHAQDQENAIKSRMEHYHKKRREMEDIQTGAKRWDNVNLNANARTKSSSTMFLTIDNISLNDNHPSIVRTHESFELIQSEGKIRYTLITHDDARICINSKMASQLKPTFISILVKELDDINMNLENVHPEDGLTGEERRNQQMEIDGGREHLRWLEKELYKLFSRMKSIERSYESSKETHGDFYQQSVNMHSQFKWYALVQLLILVVTGFMNAKTIITALKKKGFIY